jgi:hypothetical protein
VLKVPKRMASPSTMVPMRSKLSTTFGPKWMITRPVRVPPVATSIVPSKSTLWPAPQFFHRAETA